MSPNKYDVLPPPDDRTWDNLPDQLKVKHKN